MVIQHKIAKKLAGISILIAAIPLALLIVIGLPFSFVNDLSEVSVATAIRNAGLDFFSGFIAIFFFFGLPMLPAFVACFSENPLYAIGPSFSYISWSGYVYYIDYILPYQGGGASFAVLLLFFYGLPSAFLACLATFVILKILRLKIVS